MKKLISAIAMVICGGGMAQAQYAVTPFDLNPGLANSFPQYLTALGTRVCFYANSGAKGWELYSTDGTNPAKITDDINPLTASAIMPSVNRRPAAEINGRLFFSANNGILGQELYSYSGTGLPTFAVDIENGAGSSNPDNLTSLNNLLYFTATTTVTGQELWRYEPVGGLVKVMTDINIGKDSSVTGNVTAFNNKIYFTAKTPTLGNELYVLDPITELWSNVADINTGANDADPLNLVVINNKLYFSADDGAHGRELFEYDGSATPKRVTDMVAGLSSGLPTYNEPVIAGLNGKVYFSGTIGNNEYHIYSYDPANGNSVLACKINKNGSSDPLWLTPYKGKLFFSANDTSGMNNFELWSFDGGNAPVKVTDLCKSSGSQPSYLVVAGNALYFRADNCDSVGDEVFKYDTLTVGITKITPEAVQVQLYPNPVKAGATLVLHTTVATELNINIIDAIGRMIYNTGNVMYVPGTHRVVIPSEDIAAGLYYYIVTDSGGNICAKRKMVKE